MILKHSLAKPDSLREAIIAAYRMDETFAINQLLEQAALPPDSLKRIEQTAHKIVVGTRQQRKKQGGLDTFLHEYDLSSEEGIALMCLAEALLRIPDKETINRLIGDKISTAEWVDHFDKNNPLFVNAATWSLMLTGKVFAASISDNKTLGQSLKRLLSRSGEAVIRPIILQSMKIMGNQFVMGSTIEEALNRAKKDERLNYRYSYDMLGEAARTAEDAENYYKSYQHAIDAVGAAANNAGPMKSPGISVKLSALHPRYEFAKRERILTELVPRLLALAQQAKKYDIGLTVDAEEADRLDLSLDIIEAVFSNPSLAGWEGFGLAVQSYQKRAPYVLDWLAALSKRYQRRFMVRLIKGAYWDAEIKFSQIAGLEGYPVFSRKNSTDLSFIACAKKILANPDCFYAQFGTHNAHSIAVILELAGDRKDFEFQCLHGMGRSVYDQLVSPDLACRIYAPVGNHKELLGYLVRRLLENGANSSFINRIGDEETPIEKIIADPIARIASLPQKLHPRIPLPCDLYGLERKNSRGIDLSNPHIVSELKNTLDGLKNQKRVSGPIINGKLITHSPAKAVISPSNTNNIVGEKHEATAEDVEAALATAVKGAAVWGKTLVTDRASCLERAADLFEKRMPLLIKILCEEGGKQIIDCISEIRETVDYCRYYAQRARLDLVPQVLTGPTGEFDQLSLHPRGVIACISPWNFPLAIFTGQISAALAAGNAVISKPAEQTPLIAAEAVKILHEAGVPTDAVQLLPGRGSVVGAGLVRDERVSGIMFTGSTETAKLIQQTLANRAGPIVPLIAETGGQNAMIVDSSALPEQVVADTISSSFNSAGQRCSALRVLFIQEDIAPKFIDMLKGAMAELEIGDPALLSTDVGPVIDQEALKMLQEHAVKMSREAKLIYQMSLPEGLPAGHYFTPAVFELSDLSTLKREVFGPILHIIRYAAKDLDKVLDAITQTGYGLTLGIHSRIDATVKYIEERMRVGNIYVNRNIIGAVVGVQPFGGEGLSGTGPKAGGPHYLPRLCVERAISINTTAAGGNATLISLLEEE